MGEESGELVAVVVGVDWFARESCLRFSLMSEATAGPWLNEGGTMGWVWLAEGGGGGGGVAKE